WVSDVLAWSWCFGAILFPTAILPAAERWLHYVADLSTTFCSNAGLSSAAAGNAVDPRRPFDCHVGDRLLGGGMERVQALGTAALHLFDQNAAVGETDDAELADQVRRHRIAHLVVKDVPAIEVGAQAVAADLDGRHFFCGPGGPV